MINRIPLKEAILNMFPSTEDIFYEHIDKYQDYNMQFGQVLWYYNHRSELIAIRDGDYTFYISEVQEEKDE